MRRLIGVLSFTMLMLGGGACNSGGGDQGPADTGNLVGVDTRADVGADVGTDTGPSCSPVGVWDVTDLKQNAAGVCDKQYASTELDTLTFALDENNALTMVDGQGFHYNVTFNPDACEVSVGVILSGQGIDQGGNTIDVTFNVARVMSFTGNTMTGAFAAQMSSAEFDTCTAAFNSTGVRQP